MSIENHQGYKHALDRMSQMLKCKLADVPTVARRKLAMLCKLANREGGRSDGDYVTFAIHVAADVEMGLITDDKRDEAPAPAPAVSELNIDQLVGGKSDIAAMTYRKAALENPVAVKRLAGRPKCSPHRKALLLHAIKVTAGKAVNDIKSPVGANA